MKTQTASNRLEMQSSTSGSAWRWLAQLLFILMSLILVGALMSLLLSQGQGKGAYNATTITGILIVLSNGIVGLLVINRHPLHTVGWVLLLTGLMFAFRLSARTVLFMAAGGWIDSAAMPVLLAQWFENWIYLPALLLSILYLPLYFPTGKLLAKRWRVFPITAGAAIALIVIGVILSPGNYYSIYDGRNPLQIAGGDAVSNALVYLFTPLLLFALGGAIASLFFRYRQSAGVQRTQLRWLFLPLVIYIVWNIGVLTPIHIIEPELIDQFQSVNQYADFWLMSAFIPIVIGIAILRHNLFDIEIAINRTLVYGTLTTLIILLYVVTVSLVGKFVQAQTNVFGGLIATGIIAVVIQPLRERLQKLVNRLLYGQRDEPEILFSRLAQHLETADTHAAILPNLVQTIAQALKIPYVAILDLDDNDDRPALAEWGDPRAQCEIIPLTYHSNIIGQLVAAPRGKHERFNQQELTLLNTIAALTATTMRSVQLAQELSQSRQRIVTAREEERRRIRRDLHDGLGPALAAHMIQIGSAKATVKSNPDLSETILAELESDLAQSLMGIRRLVYNLRPPVLDQLGLVAALREFIEQCNQSAAGREVNIRLIMAAELPALPAAVEVAAYRIVQEAINNVLRHAQAQTCTIRLEGQAGLTITVDDDGIGMPVPITYGVGLVSMRERADELGGSFAIQERTNGTRIIAELPYSEDNKQDTGLK